MFSCDLFIFLDDVQFSRQSYTQRVQILSQGRPHWLTVPVLRSGRSGQLITETQCNAATAWKRKHVATLRASYGGHPFFADVLAVVEAALCGTSNNLAEINIGLIQALAAALQAPCRFARSSHMNVAAGGAGVRGRGKQLSPRSGWPAVPGRSPVPGQLDRADPASIYSATLCAKGKRWLCRRTLHGGRVVQSRLQWYEGCAAERVSRSSRCGKTKPPRLRGLCTPEPPRVLERNPERLVQPGAATHDRRRRGGVVTGPRRVHRDAVAIGVGDV